MDKNNIIEFLSILGAKNIRASNYSGFPSWDWVNASCPLASITHNKGTDRHPSFGILVNGKGESVYRCYTCNDDVQPLSGLVHNLWVLGIPNWEEAMRVYGECEVFSSPSVDGIFSKWENLNAGAKKVEVPESVLCRFPLLSGAFGFEAKRCGCYLFEDRGVPKKIQDMFSLRYSDNDRSILFPRIDKDHKIWWLRARSRVAKSFFSVSPSYVAEKWGGSQGLEWGDSSRFFGEQFLTEEPVFIVESETDVLRLYSLGVSNVVATGGGVQKTQLDRLYHNVVILAFDADLTGLKNRIKAEKYLKDYSTVFIMDWGVIGVKDAGELESKADFDKVFNTKVLK